MMMIIFSLSNSSVRPSVWLSLFWEGRFLGVFTCPTHSDSDFYGMQHCLVSLLQQEALKLVQATCNLLLGLLVVLVLVVVVAVVESGRVSPEKKNFLVLLLLLRPRPSPTHNILPNWKKNSFNVHTFSHLNLIARIAGPPFFDSISSLFTFTLLYPPFEWHCIACSSASPLWKSAIKHLPNFFFFILRAPAQASEQSHAYVWRLDWVCVCVWFGLLQQWLHQVVRVRGRRSFEVGNHPPTRPDGRLWNSKGPKAGSNAGFCCCLNGHCRIKAPSTTPPPTTNRAMAGLKIKTADWNSISKRGRNDEHDIKPLAASSTFKKTALKDLKPTQRKG